MSEKSYNARTIFGRLLLLNLTVLLVLLAVMAVSVVRSFSLEDQPQVAPVPTEPKSITLHVSVPANPRLLELQWSEAMQLYLDLESALLMSYGACSGPH